MSSCVVMSSCAVTALPLVSEAHKTINEIVGIRLIKNYKHHWIVLKLSTGLGCEMPVKDTF